MTSEPQAVSGSLLWQVVFLSFAVVLILFEVVRGWRLGLLRQLIRLVALVAAYAAAFFGGSLLVPLARPLFKMPDLVLSALGGAALAFIAYGTLSGIGAVLFKRTSEQDSRIVQLIYGISGAIVGLFFGLFALWLIVVSVRAVGAVAGAQVRTRSTNVHTDPDATSHALEVRRRFLGDGNEQSKIVALRDDPEISEMIAQRRFLDLLQAQRIIDAANDPVLADRIKKFDLQRALDYALQRNNHE